MKKLLAILLVALMLLSLASCVLGNTKDTDRVTTDDTQAQGQGGETIDDGEPEADITSAPDEEDDEDEDTADDSSTAKGLPIGWPDNEYTKLIPAPDCGGKVVSANEIGELFAIDLEWEMAQGLAYAKLLQDAGFGEDCVEKYEKNGYIDRTFNGVNVQLLDLFGTTTVTIMPVEAE